MECHHLVPGLLGALALASAQTIPNPSFEADSFPEWPGYISANTSISNWTAGDNARAGLNPITSGNPLNPFADNGQIPDGTNVAFIQSGTNSSLSTVISNLTVGQTYKVNFRVNARADPGSSPPGPHMPNLKVDIAGANIISATITNVDSKTNFNKAYQFFAFDFTAAATNQTLTLRNDATNNDNTVLVDNFSIALRNSGWSYAAWKDDASSGVVSNNIYTHAYNFGSSTTANINGVSFMGINGPNPFFPAGPGAFSTTGLPAVFPNDANNVTGAGSSQLAAQFVYGGNPATLTISGLTIGKSYRTTIYSVGFDASGSRAITFSVGNDRLTVNQDQFGDNNGIWVSYFFTATSTSNTITCVPLQGGGQTFHMYGFANYESPPLQIVNPSFEADTFTVGPGYVSGNFPVTGWDGVGRFGVNPGASFGPFTDNGAIPDGTKAAFIQGDGTNGTGFLTQTIHGFTNGASYQVRYFENSRNCCGNVPFAELRIGGRTIVLPHAVPPVLYGNPYYQVLSDIFVATNTSLELAFIKSNPQGGDNTLLIDNVSISPVTSNQLPVAVTLPADQFVTNSARLNGQVNAKGSSTKIWFQWGTDTNYGNLTATQTVGSAGTPLAVNAALSSLGGSDYHFRLVASNAFGVATGADQVFTIPSWLSVSIPNLPGVWHSSVAWGDFDNDGRLDFLITGSPDNFTGISQLWRNTGSGLTNVPIPFLPGAFDSSVAWGDYDNDGRLDFFLTGYAPINGFSVSQLWRNTGSGFTNVPIPDLPGVRYSSVAWGDYDNDGRLDFLITGTTNGLISQLWRNTGSGFSNVTASVAPDLPAVYLSSVAWGDYDNDGRLDFLITGNAGSIISQLWRNTGSGFSNVTANVAPGLPGVYNSSVAWGDYDNDGRLDFVITGVTTNANTAISQLWRNTGSGFSNVTASVAPGLLGVVNSSVARGDFDNDGRLDLLLTGHDGSNPRSQLWRNNAPGSNAPPAAPAGLSAISSGATITLSWNAPADDHTPTNGLNYNVRIGSTPGASDVLAPMALTNGLRLLPALGDVQTGTNALYELSRLAPGQKYYWSVQAVDTSFAGSPFATEQQFVIGPRLFNPSRSASVFEFYFTNETGLTFDVLASTNVALPLVNWTNLGSNALSLGGGLYRFTNSAPASQPQRYYMLRSQ